MDKFSTPNWEANDVGDKATNDLIKIHKLEDNSKSKNKLKAKKKLAKSKEKNKIIVKNKIESKFKKQKLHKKLKESFKSANKPNDTKISKTPQAKIIIKKNTKQKFDTIIDSSAINTKCTEIEIAPPRVVKKNPKFEKLRNKLISITQKKETNEKPERELNLRERMMKKLKAARFRYLNEQMYTTESNEAVKLFKQDPEAFKAYHVGYRQQISSWPLNPLDTIIKSIQKMPNDYVIADFGCGDARLAKSVPQRVHSFDLVAMDHTVIACDMSKVPLPSNSIDVAVYSLSLMGTNIKDYLMEASRILKTGGVLKIAEVESRFDTVETFIKGVQCFGFKLAFKDLSHNLFYFLDFKKEFVVKNKNKLPSVSLHPCLYKRR